MGNDPSTNTTPIGAKAPWGKLGLSFTVVQARGLRRTSFWGVDAPYCAIRLASRNSKMALYEGETSVDRDEGGFWNETFHIAIEDPSAEMVVVHVMNANAWLNDEVATCVIPLASFVHGCIEDMWLPLYDPHNKSAWEGEIRIRVQLHGDLRSFRSAYYQSKYTYLK
ncbi:hypothetical protein THRCLA_07450 [Thraustotheca clavata]|uniref:C2 domain-containing protein n=1 Tax=Thraustotheca clavata TaxID=74557 RepID=A0A1V9ZD68_9STRA|nr:hypothetical protein THRCLA_07450 [Thraustotheca clavata]